MKTRRRTSSPRRAWVDTPAEVGASSDVVITVLPTPKHVREVMIGNGGVLEKMKRDTTFIDMSTSSVDIANEIKTLADPRGIAVLEAPGFVFSQSPDRRIAHLSVATNLCRRIKREIRSTPSAISQPRGSARTNLLCGHKRRRLRHQSVA
ncbi:MAG: NAD(P)-dependent oxidoreductase [Actinobacteria bacterium]|nr:NAD(P)-dependent oxidoreductase [Actinomycetota bacterium]